MRHATGIAAFCLACMLAGASPFFSPHENQSVARKAFPGFPTSYEGKPLKQEDLTKRERDFYSGFSGAAAKFSDGPRQFIFRWCDGETDKFHLARRCFENAGYEMHPIPARRDADGRIWGAYRASRRANDLHVYERIYDNAGNSWSDESAWRWNRFWRQTSAPWWAVTIVEQAKAR